MYDSPAVGVSIRGIQADGLVISFLFRKHVIVIVLFKGYLFSGQVLLGCREIRETLIWRRSWSDDSFLSSYFLFGMTLSGLFVDILIMALTGDSYLCPSLVVNVEVITDSYIFISLTAVKEG